MKFLFKILSIALIPCSSFAWQPVASKPITVLIGFQPGSGNEVGFRVLAAAVSKTHPNAKFVIELKPGADSVIATNALYSAKPDGYTIGIPSYMGTFVTNDIWQKDVKKFQYNSFSNVMGMGKSPLVFVANAKSKVNTTAELIKLVQNPDRPVTFAGGAGAHRMAYEYFMLKAGGDKSKIRFATHQGPLQAVTSVAGDTGMEFGIMPLSIALPLIQSGRVKIIGITGNRTMPQMSEAEPIRINGAFINIYAAWALMLPPNTPHEIVEWYRDAFTNAMHTPEVKQYYRDNLIFVDEKEVTPEGFSKGIETLRSIWIPLSKQVNLLE